MIAKTRDGNELSIGDEVEVIGYHHTCEGKTFVICEITPYDNCESGAMVLVHLKGEPDRKIVGFQKEGYEFNHPPGLDANYFKKKL